jgi:hypothetical protein
MQDTEKKYFADPQNGTGNFDDADFALGTNQWLNLENARMRSTDAGEVGVVEAIGSTILKSQIEPSVTNVVIGSVEDNENNRILYFRKDLYGPFDSILCYDLDADTIYTVLLSSQVYSGLNFDKDKLIHSVRVINGLLYWTDNLNEPRRINIDAAINMNHPGTFPEVEAYTAPLDYVSITIIRRPPYYPPIATKKDSADIPPLSTYTQNFIYNKAVQFAYMYFFRDGEESVIGHYSNLSNYNFEDDTFNVIEVLMPLSEFIDQDVQRVELVVRNENNFNSQSVIKTWDKDNPTDLQEIEDHNNDITPLTYYYLGDTNGIAVASSKATKPFDSVPLLSETLENANNRLFLGNNLEGYNTPVQTSLSTMVIQVADGDSQTGQWRLARLYRRVDGNVTVEDPFEVWILYVSTETIPYYWYNTVNYPDTPPASIALADATLSSASLDDLTDQIAAAAYPPGETYSGNYFFSPLGDSVVISDTAASIGNVAFKSNSTFFTCVNFYDRFRRKCGIVTTAANKVTTSKRSYDQTIYNKGIQWTLSNTDAVNQIPDWAWYYSIGITLNQTASFFAQARSRNVIYVDKDADGNYTFTTTAFDENLYGVGVDISALTSFGMGYIFSEGDLIILYIDSVATPVELSIIGQDGNYVICKLVDLGTLPTSALFEIYTPYPKSTNELYYETPNIYAILNPGTSQRQYSTLQGLLNGDISLLTRTDSFAMSYLVEAMSPNDNYWKIWNRDIGWPNLIDNIGQQLKKTNISYSNTIILGTRTNGLSSFDALDEKNLTSELGPIKKLQVTSKVNNELGNVMLAICEDETASLYLGEVQLFGSNQPSTLAQAPEVIGTVNVLKGSYGTLNPESVIEFRGLVFWYDCQNGKIVQYSANGLFPISDYKMRTYWKLFSDQYNSMTQAQIEALGNRPFVFMTVDPHHYELLVSVPKLLAVPPKGYLIDYPSVIYPFDIWDGTGKTIVFKLAEEPNYWQGAMRFVAENFITAQNKLFSFKYGQLYQHNSTTGFNEFYGTQYKVRIMAPFNKQFNIPKTPDNIKIEGNMKPSLVYLYATSPYVQTTDLMDFDFKDLEGIYYSAFFRNKIVPTFSGFNTNGLLTGQKMRSIVFNMLLEFSVTSVNLSLRFVTISYQLSSGHKQ